MLELVFQLHDDWLTSIYLLNIDIYFLRLPMFSIGKSDFISCGTHWHLFLAYSLIQIQIIIKFKYNNCIIKMLRSENA